MISARSIYREILENDETYRLFCSVAAKIAPRPRAAQIATTA